MNRQFLSSLHNSFYNLLTKKAFAGEWPLTILPKKRTLLIIQNLSVFRKINIKIPYASLFSYQLIWYSMSLLMYSWFLSGIAYDIFFWHKPITQVSMINYVGSIAGIALIWVGAWLFKTPKRIVAERLRKRKESSKDKTTKKHSRRKSIATESTQTTEKIIAQPKPQTELEQPLVVAQPELTGKPISGCTHNFERRPRSEKISEIPDVCLTCKDLVQCVSSDEQ